MSCCERSQVGERASSASPSFARPLLVKPAYDHVYIPTSSSPKYIRLQKRFPVRRYDSFHVGLIRCCALTTNSDHSSCNWQRAEIDRFEGKYKFLFVPIDFVLCMYINEIYNRSVSEARDRWMYGITSHRDNAFFIRSCLGWV